MGKKHLFKGSHGKSCPPGKAWTETEGHFQDGMIGWWKSTRKEIMLNVCSFQIRKGKFIFDATVVFEPFITFGGQDYGVPCKMKTF